MSRIQVVLIVALSLFLTTSGVLASTTAPISAGDYYTVVSKEDGTVWAWGSNNYGQLGDGTKTDRWTPVQVSGLTGITAVSAGFRHTVALKYDGTVWAWGNNSYGQLGDGTNTQRLAPVHVSGLTGVVAVSAGYDHTVALKNDGTVWTWGWNRYGQLGDGTKADRSIPVQVTELTGVTAVSAGWCYTVALKSDGTVWTWGYNYNGQLGDGSKIDKLTPVQVSSLTGVLTISAGPSHTVASKSDGTVWTWGYNDNGQLGDGTTEPGLTPVQVAGFTGVTAVSSGYDYTVALKDDGTVWAWGNNSHGLPPVQVVGLTEVSAISAGSGHTVALMRDGTVWTWGNNDHGQLGDGTATRKSTPVKVRFDWIPPTGTIVINNDAAYTTSISVTLGIFATNNISTVSQMTISNDGVFDAEPWETYSTTKSWNLTSGDGPKTVYIKFKDAAGNESTIAIDSIILDTTPPEVFAPIATPSGWTEGDVTVTFSITDAVSGMNHYEVSLDYGVFINVTSPYMVSTEGDHTLQVKAVDNAGNSRISQVNACISRSAPVVYISSPYRYDRQIIYKVSYERAVEINLTTADITLNKTGTANGTVSVSSTGNEARIVTISDISGEGTLGISIAAGTASDAFGRNALSAGPSDTIKIGMGIVAVSAGSGNTIALKNDGTVWVWGSNSYGQLGDGTTTDHWTPMQVTGLTGVTTVSAGLYHTVVLRDGGTVWAWGWNKYGQLGDGTKIQRLTPVQVSGLFGVVAISTGGVHTVALKSDGSVWTWGYNYNGQLGDGTTTDRWTPVQVSNLTGVIAVSASGSYTVALKNDGTVWTWGDNHFGQLGDGTNTQRLTPVKVTGLTGVAIVSAGYNNTVALKNDGTVWAWGSNSYGQLGDGTYTQRLTPKQVTGLAGVVAISAGGYHTAILKDDSSVWAWGDNSKGQLGDGTTKQRSTPAQVAGLTGVVDVSAGGYHTVVLKDDGTVWDCGYNNYGQLGDGTTTQRLTPVEISSLDWTPPSATSISKAKGYADGTLVYVDRAIVSAAYEGFFYIESDKRESGIRVEKAGHALSAGLRSNISGTMNTNIHGERYILATTAAQSSPPDNTGIVKPLGIVNRMLGGGNWNYQAGIVWPETLSGQIGVTSGYGINNIGLLARTCGHVTEYEQVTEPAKPSWIIIDDGIRAGVKCIIPRDVVFDRSWSYITVTGISSCEKVGDDLHRVLLIRPGDVIVHN